MSIFGETKTEIQQPKIIKQPVVEKIVPVVKTVVTPSVSSSIFTTTDFKFEISQPKKEVIEQPKEEKIVENKIHELNLPNEKETLLSIVAHKKPSELTKAKKLLIDLQQGEFDNKHLRCCSAAIKPLIASEFGIVLVFEDELDAKILNKNCQTKDFILACCSLFKNPKYIVGFTTQQINDMKPEIQAAMYNKSIAPLNIDALRNVLNKDNSIAQMAYNFIYKNIDHKEDK